MTSWAGNPKYTTIVDTAKIAEDRLLRLSIATPILTALIAADSIIWSENSDAEEQEKMLIDKALRMADLLIHQVKAE